MEDQKTIGVELQDDSLADTTHAAHDLAVHGLYRRIDRSQDEGAEEGDPFEAMTDDVPVQRLEVDDDVG